MGKIGFLANRTYAPSAASRESRHRLSLITHIIQYQHRPATDEKRCDFAKRQTDRKALNNGIGQDHARADDHRQVFYSIANLSIFTPCELTCGSLEKQHAWRAKAVAHRGLTPLEPLQIAIYLTNARHLDASTVIALETLHDYLRQASRYLLISGSNHDVSHGQTNSGLLKQIGKEISFRPKPTPPFQPAKQSNAPSRCCSPMMPRCVYFTTTPIFRLTPHLRHRRATVDHADTLAVAKTSSLHDQISARKNVN